MLLMTMTMSIKGWSLEAVAEAAAPSSLDFFFFLHIVLEFFLNLPPLKNYKCPPEFFLNGCPLIKFLFLPLFGGIDQTRRNPVLINPTGSSIAWKIQLK